MTQVCSVFAQLLQLFSRGEFARAVKQHKAEKHAKGFPCWGQFVAMRFQLLRQMMVCQLANLKSIREVVLVLASCESPQKQLGLSETVKSAYYSCAKRSTLSYANAHRPWEILSQELKAHYETIFHELLKKCQAEVAGGNSGSRTSW